MNIREGARRIQYTGRLMLTIAFVALLLIILATLIANYTSTFHFPFFPLFIVLWLWPTILGALFLVTGWIVAGFAEPPHDSSVHEHARD
jgi:uncharacterized integral membrane protein